MINKFKEIYGGPNDVVIGAGDWDQKQHMKFKEPTKGIGMRRLFRNHGYQVYLVDEFRTSCMCSHCKAEDGRCDTFIKRKSPKPFVDQTKIFPVHGVLICKKCNTVWNRDVNSATNIYRIAKYAIEGKDRPKYLERSEKSVTVTKKKRVGVGKEKSKPRRRNVAQKGRNVPKLKVSD
ncbi:MAG: zinc ribbon domain-containing protein [Candidatus Nitrosocosmicus sp.]|nr:zinc ribbon domain-containing protein [Candidatus Nitrosocosmicus sp.]